jgi:hypothetical protein
VLKTAAPKKVPQSSKQIINNVLVGFAVCCWPGLCLTRLGHGLSLFGRVAREVKSRLLILVLRPAPPIVPGDGTAHSNILEIPSLVQIHHRQALRQLPPS